MTDVSTGGNTGDSPTSEGTDQAKSTTDQILDAASAASTDQSGQDAADSQTADTSKADGEGTADTALPDKDKLPFDEHPKWQSARAAEKRVNEILEAHGYDNMDDLEAAVNDRDTVRSLLGDHDAETLVSEYEEFQKVKKFWAENEAAKREADETESDTIARLKKEKQEILDRVQRDKDDKAAVEQSQRVIKEFDSNIRTTVNAITDIPDIEKSMLIEFLGVDNEMAAVDPTDKIAVKRTLALGTQRFNKFISDVKAKAIEDYVQGKSEITNIGASATNAQASTSVDKVKEIPDNATMDEVNTLAKDELLERIMKAANA